MKNSIKIILLTLIVVFSVYKISSVSASKAGADEKITATVNYIRCKSNRRKSKKSTIKVRFKQKDYIVLTSKDKCRALNIGDTISLLYSKKSDKIYFK